MKVLSTPKERILKKNQTGTEHISACSIPQSEGKESIFNNRQTNLLLNLPTGLRNCREGFYCLDEQEMLQQLKVLIGA